MIKNISPLILSIESSASTCGVAVSQADSLLIEYNIFKSNQHDKMLAVLVERVLSDLELNINNIDSLAVSAGPGSFTGLRIGAALAKGICFENKPKLIAVPTLEAIAFSLKNIAKINSDIQILALTKSHKNFYYYQIFDLEAKPINDIIFCEFEKIQIDRINETFVCGNFDVEEILNLKGKIQKNDDASLFNYYKGIFPSYISKLAYKMYNEEKFEKSEDFSPIYVQDFQLKTNKSNENKEY